MMIPQWMMAMTTLMGLALGLGKMIHQSKQELMGHQLGFEQVTQSLIQRPLPSPKIKLHQQRSSRSYEFQKKRIIFHFSSSYRKK